MTFRHIIVLTSFVIIIASPAGADDTRPVSFPFELIADEHIAVEITADDSLKGTWGLDTGGGVHLVSNRLFRCLKTRPAGWLSAFQMNGNRVDLEVYRITSLSMGDFREDNPVIATLDRLDSLGIDGILSLKFFEHQPVTIDFMNRKIIFESEQSMISRAGEGQTVDLEIQNYRDKALDIFAEFRAADSVVMEFELDTGSGKSTFIHSRLMDALGFDRESPDLKKIQFGGETLVKTGLENLCLDQAPEIRAEKTKVMFRDNLIYDGVIGIDFWKGRAVTIDIGQKRLIISD